MNVTDLKERWTKATPAVRFITIAVIALIALVTFLVLKPASGNFKQKRSTSISNLPRLTFSCRSHRTVPLNN